MTRPLRVGLIGVAPARGWAAVAHIPALRALPGFEITAVSTRRRESAEAAAAHFGVPHAFDSAHALATHPDVDVVSVCVNAPGHYDALLAALEAGKHIFCEWPLCAATPQAAEVASLARAKKVCTIVGLQSRVAPAFAYLRTLISEGYVGRVLSCSMISTWRIWGDSTPAFNAYTLDARNGGSALSIAGGHTIDTLQHCVGAFQSVAGTVRVQREKVRIIETGEVLPATAIQQFSVQGELSSGAIASIHLQGGAVNGSGLHLEINGTEGDLIASSSAQFGVTSPDVTLRGLRRGASVFADLPVPAQHVRAPESLAGGRAIGTAHLYLDLARAISGGVEAAPSFDEALRLHQLLDAIETSSETGRRQSLS